jgi:hypothetical protein
MKPVMAIASIGILVSFAAFARTPAIFPDGVSFGQSYKETETLFKKLKPLMARNNSELSYANQPLLGLNGKLTFLFASAQTGFIKEFNHTAEQRTGYLYGVRFEVRGKHRQALRQFLADNEAVAVNSRHHFIAALKHSPLLVPSEYDRVLALAEDYSAVLFNFLNNYSIYYYNGIFIFITYNQDNDTTLAELYGFALPIFK